MAIQTSTMTKANKTGDMPTNTSNREATRRTKEKAEVLEPQPTNKDQIRNVRTLEFSLNYWDAVFSMSSLALSCIGRDPEGQATVGEGEHLEELRDCTFVPVHAR
eukprot:3002201-Amphidinium_carterae.1